MTASTSSMSSAIKESTDAVLAEDAVKASLEELRDYRKCLQRTGVLPVGPAVNL